MTLSRVLLATRSPGKLRELRALFAPSGVAVVDLDEQGIAESPAEEELERFDTFEENALAKARHFHMLTGLPTIADDSGLEVRSLGGAPGVRSKRWSGRADLAGEPLDAENNRKLLAELAGQDDREARYVCVAVLVDGLLEVVRRGETRGAIVAEPRGSGGFGYDPYFLSAELGRTFGEASLEEKQRVSHRGRAFSALLDAIGGGGSPRTAGAGGVDLARGPD